MSRITPLLAGNAKYWEIYRAKKLEFPGLRPFFYRAAASLQLADSKPRLTPRQRGNRNMHAMTVRSVLRDFNRSRIVEAPSLEAFFATPQVDNAAYERRMIRQRRRAQQEEQLEVAPIFRELNQIRERNFTSRDRVRVSEAVIDLSDSQGADYRRHLEDIIRLINGFLVTKPFPMTVGINYKAEFTQHTHNQLEIYQATFPMNRIVMVAVHNREELMQFIGTESYYHSINGGLCSSRKRMGICEIHRIIH